MAENAVIYNGLIGFAATVLLGIGSYLVFSDIVKKNPWTFTLITAVLAWMAAEVLVFVDHSSGYLYRWTTVKYVALSFIGPAWFGLATRFAARSKWVGARGSALLIASGSLFALAVITDPIHGWLNVGAPEDGGGRLFRSGPLWHLLMAYILLCLIAGLVVVAREVKRFPPMLKRRGNVLLIAVIGPTAVALLDIFSIPLPTGFPQAPLAIVFSSVVLFYGFVRLRLFTPLRLARETVIDMLTDPVVVIDESMRIALSNSAARTFTAAGTPADPGVRLDDAFPGLEAIVAANRGGGEADWAFGEKEYLVRLTFIETARAQSRAVIATLSDVTALMDERERLERLVEERTAQLKRTNEELEESRAMHEASEARLRETLKEKELLMKEIHHRVKNNLQIVASLINLQSNRITDPEAKAACASLKNRIKSITLVHQRIYQSSNFTRVELGQYVRELSALVAASVAERSSPVSVEVPEDTLMVDPDSCIDIGLLLNELIVNAVKHGRTVSGSGKVTIRMEHVDEIVRITVRDEGPGFSPGAQERSDSLGIKIIQATAMKYGAAVTFENVPGALVTVTFPTARILA